MTELLDQPVSAEPDDDVVVDGVIHTEVATEEGLRQSRGVLAVSLSTLGTGSVVGGIFLGAGGRVVACIAGLLGVLVGVGASRLKGNVTSQLALLAGVGAT
ncbi:MAG: hypothetical protein JWN31_1636, partial [Frankiales bacterium]|nr:hypothetical protein [Frankiales bacterium]